MPKYYLRTVHKYNDIQYLSYVMKVRKTLLTNIYCSFMNAVNISLKTTLFGYLHIKKFGAFASINIVCL